MIVVGVVGGIASGKSLVSSHLSTLGAEVIDVDQIGHRTLREADVKRRIFVRWGKSVLDESGEIDRKKLGNVVFGENVSELRDLEAITTPRITEHLVATLEDLRDRETYVAVVDAAILFKAGWHKHCDVLLFVDTERKLRVSRALDRGWTVNEFAVREAAQEPPEVKMAKSGVIIDNNGTIDETYRQTEQFWYSLDDFSSRSAP